MAFALTPWDSLKTQLQCNQDFGVLWRQACESYENLVVKKPAVFNAEAFCASDQQGYRVEQPCELLTQDAVQERYHMSLKEMAAEGIPIEKLKDERGMAVEGILVPSGAKTWTVFASYSTDYSERVHNESQQLRAGQGHDIKGWYRQDLAKVNPLGVAKGGKCVQLSDLAAVAAKVQEARRVEEEKAKLFAIEEKTGPGESAAAVEKADAVKEEENGDEEDDAVQYDLVESEFTLQGPSAKNSKKKDRAAAAAKTGKQSQSKKQKTKSGSTIGADIGRRLTKKTAVSGASCASASVFDGASVTEGGGKPNSKDSKSPSELAQECYNNNVAALDIEKLLSCLMSEGYVPKLCQGERTKAEILEASIHLVETWAPLLQTTSPEEKLDAMVECAVSEIVQVARALVAILADHPGQHGGSKDVAALVDAKQGLAMIMKQAPSASASET